MNETEWISPRRTMRLRASFNTSPVLRIDRKIKGLPEACAMIGEAQDQAQAQLKKATILVGGKKVASSNDGIHFYRSSDGKMVFAGDEFLRNEENIRLLQERASRIVVEQFEAIQEKLTRHIEGYKSRYPEITFESLIERPYAFELILSVLNDRVEGTVQTEYRFVHGAFHTRYYLNTGKLGIKPTPAEIRTVSRMLDAFANVVEEVENTVDSEKSNEARYLEASIG